MRLRDEESGQMLVLTALCMTVLMGFLAMAIDVGMLFRAKRNVQIAADAGAIAGALQEQYGGTVNPSCGNGVSSVTCAVDNAVGANGVPAADVVAANTNPTDGYHKGTGYVEAIVSAPNPTFFFSAFRGAKTSFNVTARAVAGLVPSTACMYVLDPTDANSLNIQGKVTAPGCGIQVNSNNADASCDQGAAIAAPFLHIAGGQDAGGGCQPTNSTQVVTGVAPSGDPLNNMTGVSVASVCTPINTVLLGGANPTVTAATIIPSTTLLIGNVAVAASCFGDLNVLLSALTLGRPGSNQLFIFENGVQLLGNVTVNGTIDIAQGTLVQGAAQLTINAPADPADMFNGIALFEPSTNATPCSPTLPTPCLQVRLVGGGLNGIIYAPTSRVSIQGQGGVGGIVAYQLDVTGPLSLTENYNLANPSTSPLNKVELVE
jgi:Flp pilus assembly protein TadG